MGRSEERGVRVRTYGARVLGWCARARLLRACAYVPSLTRDRSGSAAEGVRACTHHSLGLRVCRCHLPPSPSLLGFAIQSAATEVSERSENGSRSAQLLQLDVSQQLAQSTPRQTSRHEQGGRRQRQRRQLADQHEKKNRP